MDQSTDQEKPASSLAGFELSQNNLNSTLE